MTQNQYPVSGQPFDVGEHVQTTEGPGVVVVDEGITVNRNHQITSDRGVTVKLDATGESLSFAHAQVSHE